ncbi:hypothetical protein K440DRAFT_597519 [Wilcoxina mikolae CBS 423.85]|nr:hypothetical protein K440DRAFT_597519 [Wilcoxina mikolae CBS 423.85]
MLPLATSPPLHLALLLGKDSTGEYECQGERKEHEGNGIEMAQKKLRMAAHLVQAFTAEQMYRNRMGRRCFRLEEEWDFDTLSNRATNGTMRNLAKVHVIRLESTVDEIHSIEKAENGEMLRKVARKAVDAHFGGGTKAAKRYIATVLIDAKGHLQFQGISAHSALSDGMGIVGGHSLYTLPSCIEEVVPSFSNCTRIGGSAGSPNSADPVFFWEAATAVLGVMMEAFLSPQSPIEPRDFSKVNRTFVTKEPYSLKTKSPGLKLSLPQKECSWPRVDCLRFRYHPCFRLPTDPISPPLPDAPQIYAVDNGIVAGASSGVALVLIYVGDTYRDYIEYTTKPEREVLLQEDFIRSKLPDIHRSAIVKLKVYSAGQGETIVEDFHAARNLKVQLPNGYGSAFKSSSLGPSETADPQSQQVILHSITTGRMLTGIRVFHTSAAWDGLEFLYEDSSSQLFGHRGTTGDANSSKKPAVSDFTLDARKGESLLGFQLRVCGGRFVDGIEILTSFGRRSSVFGNPQGGSISTTLVPPRGRSIAGVSGTCAERVDGFSILYK